MNSKHKRKTSVAVEGEHWRKKRRWGGRMGPCYIRPYYIIKKRFGFYLKCNGKLIFPILGNGIITNPLNLLSPFWLFPFLSNFPPFILIHQQILFISEINIKSISSSSATLSTKPHHLVSFTFRFFLCNPFSSQQPEKS